MGKINLLKNGYRGKVGQTVGQQWNGELTLRVHNEHNYSKTQPQLEQRDRFKAAIEFSSKGYPYTLNIKPPKKYNGSKWNFISTIFNQLTSGNIDPSKGIIAGDYKRANIILPLFPQYNGKFHMYVYKEATNGSLDPTGYQLAAIPILQPGVPIPPGLVTPSFGQIINKSITVPLTAAGAKKGFLIELNTPPIDQVIYLFALQGRNITHEYKSTFNICIPAVTITDNMLEDN